MLRSLHIENIAVIRKLDLELEPGFTVLTGETGAGKSIIIDSINFLLGNRTNKEIIRTGETKAAVSGVFEDLPETVRDQIAEMGFPPDDGALMLQRTLTADGKTQYRINGQSVTQGIGRDVCRMLVNIHGQNDTQKLLQKSTHLSLVDGFLQDEKERAEYSAVYKKLKETEAGLKSLSCDAAEKLRLSEMLKFQIADIDSVKLKIGEEETLTHELDRLSNLEKINKQIQFSYYILKGSDKSATVLADRAKSAVSSLGDLLPNGEELSERLEAVRSELEDVAETILEYADESGEDPTARIDRIEARLDSISKLERKYGATIEAVLSFREKANQQLSQLNTSEELREELEERIAELKKEAERKAGVLTKLRKKAAGEITKSVTETLSFLDMPKVRFAVSVEPAELNPEGADDVEFLIATNPGEPLRPMIRIASGGELSRVMLALRSVLNDKEGASTVIFDEVDTGISGKTSRKVGIKLSETARNVQVFCVTHSAQIASLADKHYLISKNERDGRAETSVTLLDDEGRITEVSRILGGIEVTEAQRAAAREMIEEYRKD